jgi:hypothetical protein
MELTVEGIFKDIVARDIKSVIGQQNNPTEVKTNSKYEQGLVAEIVARDIKEYVDGKHNK